MNVSTTAQTGPVAKGSRYGLIALAWLFAAGGVVQIFLAGLSVFESPTYWVDHVDFGRMIGILTYLLPILALIGRVGRTVVLHAMLITVLFVLQMILANLDAGYVAALHAVNAFFLVGASFGLGMRTLGLVRSVG